MKTLFKLLAVLFICSITFSCGDKNDEEEKPADDTWNKNRTTNIMVFSRLADGNLLTAQNYTTVANQITAASPSVCLLDRSNVTYGTTMENFGVNVAASAKRVPIFVPISKNGANWVGSTVLLSHTFQEMVQQPVVDECKFLNINTTATAQLPMVFGTLSFTESNQIDPGVQLMKNNMKLTTVIVGIVKRSLMQTLESKITSAFTAGTYSFEKPQNANAGSEYALYILSSSKWKYRELIETTVSADLKSFQLKVESLR